MAPCPRSDCDRSPARTAPPQHSCRNRRHVVVIGIGVLQARQDVMHLEVVVPEWGFAQVFHQRLVAQQVGGLSNDDIAYACAESLDVVEAQAHIGMLAQNWLDGFFHKRETRRRRQRQSVRGGFDQHEDGEGFGHDVSLRVAMEACDCLQIMRIFARIHHSRLPSHPNPCAPPPWNPVKRRARTARRRCSI